MGVAALVTAVAVSMGVAALVTAVAVSMGVAALVTAVAVSMYKSERRMVEQSSKYWTGKQRSSNKIR